MFRLDAQQPRHLRDGITRRDFLHAGAFSLFGLGLTLPECMAIPAQGAVRGNKDLNCILLFLTGAPSQLDTWDMKPHATREIRGPFAPIKTNVQGMEISELFPRMAKRADMFSIVRSMCHTEAVTHETGRQRMQVGGMFAGEVANPNSGRGARYGQFSPESMPAQVVLPHLLMPTEGSLSHQAFTRLSSSKMREAFDMGREPDRIRDKYGRNTFGQSCLLARRMVERGVRCVTVNMFDSVDNEITWDAHGHTPFAPLDSYKTLCGPRFDNGYTSLIEELQERGLYDNTIVIATGEFGRAPRINAAGGRDHWPHCWSLILGGGGISGGQIVGASDDIAAYPTERPTTPADIAATLSMAMGIDLPHELPTHNSRSVPIINPAARPLRELL